MLLLIRQYLLICPSFYRPPKPSLRKLCFHWYLSVHGGFRSLSWGRGLCPGDLCLGLSGQGVSVQRGSPSRGSMSGGVSVTSHQRTVTCGRYASYWNAFLLFLFLPIISRHHLQSTTPGRTTNSFVMNRVSPYLQQYWQICHFC